LHCAAFYHWHLHPLHVPRQPWAGQLRGVDLDPEAPPQCFRVDAVANPFVVMDLASLQAQLLFAEASAWRSEHGWICLQVDLSR
jgi:hypothetical protein